MDFHHGRHPSKRKYAQVLILLANRNLKIHERFRLVGVKTLALLATNCFLASQSPIWLHQMALDEQYEFRWYAMLQQLNEVIDAQ